MKVHLKLIYYNLKYYIYWFVIEHLIARVHRMGLVCTNNNRPLNIYTLLYSVTQLVVGALAPNAVI